MIFFTVKQYQTTLGWTFSYRIRRARRRSGRSDWNFVLLCSRGLEWSLLYGQGTVSKSYKRNLWYKMRGFPPHFPPLWKGFSPFPPVAANGVNMPRLFISYNNSFILSPNVHETDPWSTEGGGIWRLHYTRNKYCFRAFYVQAFRCGSKMFHFTCSMLWLKW